LKLISIAMGESKRRESLKVKKVKKGLWTL